MTAVPTFNDIHQAADRINNYIHHTPVKTSSILNSISGAKLFFKCENFQKAGAFKSRGALNAVLSLNQKEAARGVATHSSGNHAAALARAAWLRKIPAHIVMPENSSKVKIAAVKHYQGIITFCEPNLNSRETTLARVLKVTEATEIHPYNDLRIIAGQATACYELIVGHSQLDTVIAPVGGGGLLSGTAISAHYMSPGIEVIGAEPKGADDALRSFESGKLIPSENPKTIADGLLTSLGSLTFPIITKYVNKIITVSEESIITAMRLIWERMKIIVEPSSAVPFAAVLENPGLFAGKNIGIIVSGGNVDLDNLPWIKN